MNKAEAELIQFKRQAIESEIAHRREKLWRIFSWVGSLLVAIIGGFIALRANEKSQFNPNPFQRGILIFAVGVLTLYAFLWLTQNIHLEGDAQKDLDKYDGMLDIEHTKTKRTPLFQFVRKRFGYNPALILLAVAAILTILFA